MEIQVVSREKVRSKALAKKGDTAVDKEVN